jgi:putative ABC transport system permease protein
MKELLHACRQMRQHPGFTAVAVLTLALGIGANTAIFSVLHAVVLHPFSYPEADRILFMTVHDRKDDRNVNSFSYPDLRDYREQLDVFEQFGGALDGSLVVTGIEDPTRVKGCYLSPGLFDLLRTPPQLGRTLTEGDDHRGAERVAVLNHSAWQRFFGGAADVIGRAIELDGRSYTVVGVMPANFKFWNAQVYLPLIHGVPVEIENTRAATIGIWGVGRLKPGVTLAAANAALDQVARRLEAAHPDSNRDAFAHAQPLAETVSAQIRPTLMLLFGAVGFVLLIACVNVTNLLLARGATRGREIAVRAALGASRARIFRQLLLETVPVALLGGALGVAFAVGGLQAILKVIPRDLIPAEATIGLSLPVLLFTGSVSLLAALLAGVLPALQAARLELNDGLKEAARGTGDLRSGRLRASLIVAEVALALTLLIGAGLLTRDLSRLIRIDPGFRVEGLLAVRLDLPEVRYGTPGRAEVFVREMIDRVGHLPGVLHAATARSAPFGSSSFNMPMMVAGKSYERFDNMINVAYNPITDDAITTLGARLVDGRLFTDRDRAGGERVVLLSETAARKFFPDGDALGKQVAPGVPANLAAGANIPAELIAPPWSTVVGIVSDVRQFGFQSDPQPQVYVPYEQSFTVSGTRDQVTLLVRTAGAPEQLINSLRQELRSLDPNLPTDSIEAMSSLARDSVRPQRFVALLLGIFATVAAVLAAVGIYSVVAWTVAQRTREVGIRLALGASPDSVVARLVRKGLSSVGIGIGIGVVVSLGLARLLSHQLAQVKSYDPITYLAVAALLAAVAAVACWLPARRAARVDPMVALRTE